MRIGLLSGERLIVKQNSLIKELPSKGVKEFCPNNSWIEKKQIESKLEEKFNFINSERIEKSNNVSVAEWIPHMGKARVLKKVGKHWETIGHHQDNDDWLLPEEVIFLVENCELQLILNGALASVEDCYAILLVDNFCSLDEYRVYAYLSRAGLRVVRHAPSVTITAYEKQVNLDSVLQKRKRSPLHTFEPKLSNKDESDGEEVTIIEVENESLNNSKKGQENILNKNIKNNDVVEIIEIDDDVDPCPLVPELIDNSDDGSSDIVCISSPSYVSKVQSRLWYPRSHESLRRSMEKIIDLCNEDLSDELEESNCNKLDLIRVARGEVLSHLPSAKKVASVIQSPDIRLLPKNIVPKYSEYKVNLNIRSDTYQSETFQRGYSINPENSFMVVPQTSSEFMNNPLFRKAEEMQVMAMNMIQTASTLMSVLTSENPNELWNLVDTKRHNLTPYESRRRNMSPYCPRINSFQHRPYYRHPRRNFRSIKKNYREKRYNSNYFKRSYESNYVSRSSHQTCNNNISASTEGCSSEIKMEVVVLSDEEEIFCESNSDELLRNEKRKISDLETGSKKLKTKDCNLESTEKLKENLPNTVEHNFDNVNKSEVRLNGEENIKEEYNFLPCDFKNEELLDETQVEMRDGTTKILSPSKSCSNVNNIKAEIFTEKENNPDNSIKQEQFNSAYSPLKGNIEDLKSCNESIVDHTLLISCTKVEEESTNIISEAQVEEKITCWKDYKNTDEPFLDDDTETLLKFEECSLTHRDVLKTLQIFQSGGMAMSANKFRIIYDVYLPYANFKKSLRVLPNFRIIISKSVEELPTAMDLDSLRKHYQDQIPFIFSVVFNETVGFYFYEPISLTTYFE